jgi:hypothetical protein
MTEETTTVEDVVEETTTEETKPKFVPLTNDELTAITARLEKDEEFDTELARAVFTVLVIGVEYQNLYVTLQAYYKGAQSACLDLAGACANVIGIRDLKKIQKLYKLAGKYAESIPSRVDSLLLEMEQQPEEETEKEETNE